MTRTRRYQPMATAPKDGRDVWINSFCGEVRARYLDCRWLRADMVVQGVKVAGDPAVTDCWRTADDDDIELTDALGWRTAKP